MKIGIFPRLTAGYLVVLLLLGASNLYAIRQLVAFNALMRDSYHGEIRLLDAGQRMTDALFSQRRYEQKYLITGDPLLREQFLSARDDFRRSLAEVSALPAAADRRELLRQILSAHEGYQKLVGAEGRQAGERRPGPSAYRKAKEAAADAVLEALARLEASSRAGLQQKAVLVGQAGLSARRTALLSFTVSLLLVILLAFLLTRSITAPLVKLVRKTREIEAGRFEGPARIAAPPEIEELADAFDRMSGKLKEAEKMKADFFAMTSHELKTPLTTIKEGASLLLDEACGPLTERQRRLLTIVTEESNRLAGMVHSILSLSRMEAGMTTYAFAAGRVGPLVTQAVNEIMPYAEAKGIRLEVRAGEGLPLCRLDGERILDVLRNLLGNAVKFTPAKGRVEVAADMVNGGLEVSVSDTGPGVPAERRQAIFDKYQSTDQKKGTGLGLAIVKHIVAAHGGKVWVESASGEGSRFVFWLPC